MDAEQALTLIKRNTLEIINEASLSKAITAGERPRIYCGYEPSGPVHLGHLVSITKLVDLQDAGCDVIVLFADWHAYLNQKGTWEDIQEHTATWQTVFTAAGLGKATFVKGSDIQRSVPYIDDVFALAVKTTINRGLRSMQTVARDITNAKISQVIYPLMQVADFKHLNVDGALGGIEQRKIHMLALETLSSLNYKTPFFIHHELIPSIKGPREGKMSSSQAASMISLVDDDDAITKKLQNAYCPEGKTEDNPVLAIAKLIIFPRLKKEEAFKLTRPDKFGGDTSYATFEDLRAAYENRSVHPADLKRSCALYLQEIIRPLRKQSSQRQGKKS
ncbi:tyrosine--tRNA ligase [Candidatus Woesearchaeota archaeon]|nr:MAG: tyrosine--tRNA ligase [Candidatus Woesearchaeota archaeon]